MTQKEYIRMEMKKRLKKLRAQIKGGEEVGSACYYTSAYCRRRIDSAISLIPEMMKRYPSLSEDILLDVFNQAFVCVGLSDKGGANPFFYIAEAAICYITRQFTLHSRRSPSEGLIALSDDDIFLDWPDLQPYYFAVRIPGIPYIYANEMLRTIVGRNQELLKEDQRKERFLYDRPTVEGKWDCESHKKYMNLLNMVSKDEQEAAREYARDIFWQEVDIILSAITDVEKAKKRKTAELVMTGAPRKDAFSAQAAMRKDIPQWSSDMPPLPLDIAQDRLPPCDDSLDDNDLDPGTIASCIKQAIVIETGLGFDPVSPATVEKKDKFIVEDPCKLAYGLLLLLEDNDPIMWSIGLIDGVIILAISCYSPFDFRGPIKEATYIEYPAPSALIGTWKLNPMTTSAEDDDAPSKYTVARVISKYTGVALPGVYEEDLKYREALEKAGLDDNSVQLILYFSFIIQNMRRFEEFIENLPDEDEDTSNEQDLQQEIEKLRGLNRGMRESNRELKDRIAELVKENRTLREAKENLEQAAARDQQELSSLREFAFQAGQQSEGEVSKEYSVEFPYTVGRKIVVYGGHETWLKQITAKLPGVKFMGRSCVIDPNTIRYADEVWIQPNAISHSLYYNVAAVAKQCNKPLLFFSKASAEQCALQVAERDRQQ